MNRNTCENCLLFWDTTGRCKKCLIVNGMPTLWQTLKPKRFSPQQIALAVLLVFIAFAMVYVAHGIKEPVKTKSTVVLQAEMIERQARIIKQYESRIKLAAKKGMMI